MLGSRQSESRVRLVVTCLAIVAPIACARGIDNPLDEQAADASPPITVGPGASSTVGPGTGGFAGRGATAAGGASSAGRGGNASATSVTSGAGGGAPGTGGIGGATGMGGATGTGASAGMGGGAGAVAGGGAGAGGSLGLDAGVDAGGPPRPTGVRVGPTSTPSGQQAASTGGTAFQQSCAANEVVIGYTGTVDAPDSAMNQLRTFRAVCASLSVSAAITSVVNTTTKEILPAVGTMPGVVQQTEMCPTDQIVVGFSGRSGADIDQIVALCAPLSMASGSSYALAIGTEMARPPVGGPGGEPFAAIRCPAGQVAMGNEGRAAFTINAFGLLCATPSLVFP